MMAISCPSGCSRFTSRCTSDSPRNSLNALSSFILRDSPPAWITSVSLRLFFILAPSGHQYFMDDGMLRLDPFVVSPECAALAQHGTLNLHVAVFVDAIATAAARDRIFLLQFRQRHQHFN